MINPFENSEIKHLVLVNGEGQYSIWPEFAEVPKGWVKSLGPVDRKSCLEYIDANWLDMRPTSLIKASRDLDRKKAN